MSNDENEVQAKGNPGQEGGTPGQVKHPQQTGTVEPPPPEVKNDPSRPMERK
jgi:hypothetical protein